MSFKDSLLQIVFSVGRSVARDVMRAAKDKSASRKPARRSSQPTGATKAGQPGKTGVSGKPSRAGNKPSFSLPGRDEQAVAWPIAKVGLPSFEYQPRHDGFPDPGEVVWAWVPFDENDGRGKDRPVLVVADMDDHVIFAQMSSKDHDSYTGYEERQGRQWLDIGSGLWDSKGRNSEVRLDRLLVAHVGQVRREGSTLDRARYDAVVAALKELHG